MLKAAIILLIAVSSVGTVAMTAPSVGVSADAKIEVLRVKPHLLTGPEAFKLLESAQWPDPK